MSDHGLNDMRFRVVDMSRTGLQDLQDLLPLMMQEHSTVKCWIRVGVVVLDKGRAMQAFRHGNQSIIEYTKVHIGLVDTSQETII